MESVSDADTAVARRAAEARKKAKAPPRPRVYLSFPHSTEPPTQVLPGSLRIHPRGFRLLKGSSPLERRMNTYFRLPPRPERKVNEERQKLMKAIAKILPPPGATSISTQHRVVLDGFILLEAAGVQDPADAKECVLHDSNLSGSASEDLPYFTSLTFLDVGENFMELADLRHLPALEEVHLHCNGIKTLRLDKPKNAHDQPTAGEDDEEPLEEPTEPFQSLHTLNLSFNSIAYRDVALLSQLRSLERLDLSSNNLRHLPEDLSGLLNVSQLALENNKFRDPNVLLALSTMPSLVEVNLNFNAFTSVPKFSVDDGQGVCFPLLQVIGLASNQIEFFEDVYSLTQLTTLRRVVLWGNPVERKMKDCEILVYEFGALQVQVVLDSPVPPKRSIGEFYSANTQNFVRVTEKELKPIPKRGQTLRKPNTAPAATSAHEGDGATGGPSFFVTQVGLEQTTGAHGDEGHRDDTTQDDAGRGARRAHQDATEDSWFASNPVAEPVGGAGPSSKAGRGGRVEREDIDVDDGRSAVDTAKGIPSFEAADWTTPGAREDVCRPNANVRSVMAELKRMLRQPLPPIHVAQFEQSTASSRNNRSKR